MPFLSTQPVTQLITSCLYSTSSTSSTSATKTPGGGASAVEDGSPYVQDIADKYDFRPLVVLFRTEFCRRHALPKEEPLEVVVDLGSRGGALNVIEKARRVMGDRLGNIRTWDELPVSLSRSDACHGHVLMIITMPDGGAVTAVQTIPLGVCVSRLQGASDRGEPADDAQLRSYNCQRELQPHDEGRVSRPLRCRSFPDQLIRCTGEDRQSAHTAPSRRHRTLSSDCTFSSLVCHTYFVCMLALYYSRPTDEPPRM